MNFEFDLLVCAQRSHWIYQNVLCYRIIHRSRSTHVCVLLLPMCVCVNVKKSDVRIAHILHTYVSREHAARGIEHTKHSRVDGKRMDVCVCVYLWRAVCELRQEQLATMYSQCRKKNINVLMCYCRWLEITLD